MLLHLFKDNVIRTESELPLYFQLSTFIKNLILSKQLKPGDMIPSEKQLCDIYGISRTTVRQALDKLAKENLIIRRRGRGSYIANPKVHRNLDHLYNFTDDMKRIGLSPSSKVIMSRVIEASENMSKLFNISDNADVFKLVRVRLADNEPLLLEETYIPLYVCPDITNIDFNKNSLYSILQTMYGLKLEKATETYEAVNLDIETAKILNCQSLSAAFSIQRIGYLENDTAFELTNSLVRSDKCVFTVELKTGTSQAMFMRNLNV